MLEFSIPLIVAGLEEVARTIGTVMRERLMKKPVEKDLEQLYKNIRFYYQETRKLVKEEGSAEELAEAIETDDLFFWYITNEKAKKIVEALIVVAILSDRKTIVRRERRKGKEYTLKQAKYDREEVLSRILKCLEVAKNISIQ